MQLGLLEAFQPLWLLKLNAGVSFILVTLAMIAIWTGLYEVYGRLGDPPTSRKYFTPFTYAMFFANRVLIGSCVVLSGPAMAYRYGVDWMEGYETPIYALLIVGQLCGIAYFLFSETLRLMFTGEYTLRRAIKQSWTFVFACVILGSLGALLF